MDGNTARFLMVLSISVAIAVYAISWGIVALDAKETPEERLLSQLESSYKGCIRMSRDEAQCLIFLREIKAAISKGQPISAVPVPTK